MTPATWPAIEQIQARRGSAPGELQPVARTSWPDSGLPTTASVAAGDPGLDQRSTAALAIMAKLAAGRARAGRKLADDGDTVLGRPLRGGKLEGVAAAPPVGRPVEYGVELRCHRIAPIVAGRTQGHVELG